jgi:hypothetical protein
MPLGEAKLCEDERAGTLPRRKAKQLPGDFCNA